MREDLPLSDTLSGTLAGDAFGGYRLAIIASVALTARLGPRTVTMSAAGTAILGLVLIDIANSPVVPDRPASGLAIAFLALAIGQTIGAPVLGLLLDLISTGTAVLAFAVGTVVLAALPSATAGLPGVMMKGTSERYPESS